MNDISRLPHQFDRERQECQAIIETPKGHRNKFKYVPEAGLFTLSNLLPEGFSFPFDFGFIPSTSAEDGDPLDVIVLMDEPAHVGCLLKVRLIGVIRVKQIEEDSTSQNDRLVAVAARSFEYDGVNSVDELRRPLLQQVTEFIALYNKNSGKQDEVEGVEGPQQAMDLLEVAIKKSTRSR
jgi:inorganic pyrophosphatase